MLQIIIHYTGIQLIGNLSIYFQEIRRLTNQILRYEKDCIFDIGLYEEVFIGAFALVGCI